MITLRRLLATALVGAASLAVVTTPAHAVLPADRALEKVSPDDKSSGDAILPTFSDPLTFTANYVSPHGGKVVFDTFASFSGSPSGYINQYLAERTSTGWTTKSLTPPMQEGFSSNADFIHGYSKFACDDCATSLGILPFDAAPNDTNNKFDLYSSAGGTWTLVSQGSLPNPTGVPDYGAFFSAAGGRVIGFHSTSVLEPEAAGTDPGAEIAYVRENGRTSVVGLNTDGTLVSTSGAVIGGNQGGYRVQNAISADGRRVFFTAGLSTPQLYVREDGATTRQLNVSRCTRGDCDTSLGTVLDFLGASSDGDTVYFDTNAQLVNDDADTNTDIYRYRLSSGSLDRVVSRAFGRLGQSPIPALKSDGSAFYVTSADVLTSTPNVHGDMAQANDESKTYLIRPDASPSGRATFIGQDVRVVSASPNFEYAVLLSANDLGAPSTDGTLQVYRYDAKDDVTTCLSCRPSGAQVPAQAAEFTDSPQGPSNDGTVLFHTPAALDPRDDNGTTDVYLRQQGQTYLLTNGHDTNTKFALGVTPDGSEVYFATADRLLPTDHDDNADVYVAKVGGGFPQPPAAPAECVGESCQGAPSVRPATTTIGTVSFNEPEGSLPAQRAAAVTARKRTVRGSRITLDVRVPAAGTVTVKGARIAERRSTVSRSKTTRVTVALTVKARRTLKRTRTLAVALRVTYRPVTGPSSSTVLNVTVKA